MYVIIHKILKKQCAQFSHSMLDNYELKNFNLQYLLNPMHHYKAENLKFSKMHKKALTFKVCKRILTEFM